MKHSAVLLGILLTSAIEVCPQTSVFSPDVKTLQAYVNQDWLSPPVMILNSDDILEIEFDEMSHSYRRYIYKIEHCEPDMSISAELFESDYLVGFNNNPIEDYQNSINTTVPYTHYSLRIPNDKCRLKMSGNYRLSVFDEEDSNKKVLQVDFKVAEQSMGLAMNATSNTDIDVNDKHQQIAMQLDYRNTNITNIAEQIYTIVTQNASSFNMVINPKPNIITGKGLKWQHNKQLIFPAGNEYRKFEVLALSHPTMGIENISWDGNKYNAYPFVSEPRKNYLFDRDANGYFYIRNSDNIENDFMCDYVDVYYKLMSPPAEDGKVIIDGQWTNEDAQQGNYTMAYDSLEQCYNTHITQKQGYYSYRFVNIQNDGQAKNHATEGNFYQTENRYQAYVYYKPQGGRTWLLAAYRQLVFDKNEQ